MTSGAFKSAILAASVGRSSSRVEVYYRCRIESEVVYLVRSTPTYGPDRIHSLEVVSQEWEILRAQEGTTAVDHPAGSVVEMLS